MKKASQFLKRSPAAQLLRIGGDKLRMVQFQDYLDTSSPSGNRAASLNLVNATLSDANDAPIFTGQVIVRITTAIPPVSLQIIASLLIPVAGFFVIVVNGTYQVVTSSNYAEVIADTVLTTNIQPITRNSARGKLFKLPVPS